MSPWSYYTTKEITLLSGSTGVNVFKLAPPPMARLRKETTKNAQASIEMKRFLILAAR